MYTSSENAFATFVYLYCLHYFCMMLLLLYLIIIIRWWKRKFAPFRLQKKKSVGNRESEQKKKRRTISTDFVQEVEKLCTCWNFKHNNGVNHNKNHYYIIIESMSVLCS